MAPDGKFYFEQHAACNHNNVSLNSGPDFNTTARLQRNLTKELGTTVRAAVSGASLARCPNLAPGTIQGDVVTGIADSWEDLDSSINDACAVGRPRCLTLKAPPRVTVWADAAEIEEDVVLLSMCGNVSGYLMPPASGNVSGLTVLLQCNITKSVGGNVSGLLVPPQGIGTNSASGNVSGLSVPPQSVDPDAILVEPDVNNNNLKNKGCSNAGGVNFVEHHVSNNNLKDKACPNGGMPAPGLNTSAKEFSMPAGAADSSSLVWMLYETIEYQKQHIAHLLGQVCALSQVVQIRTDFLERSLGAPLQDHSFSGAGCADHS